MNLWTAGILSVIVILPGANATRPDAHYKKDVVVSYVTVAPDKTVRRSDCTVSSVTVTGDRTRFTFRTIYINEIGDTGNIYYDYYFMDKKNYWWQLKGPAYSWEGSVETMAGDSMVFPFGMKIGDTLAPCYKNNSWTSKPSSGISNHFYFNRKVTAQDTVLTRLGKIAAFRIEYKDSHYYKYVEPPGTRNEEFTEIIPCQVWFSPEYGIVKWQSEDKIGQWKTILQTIR